MILDQPDKVPHFTTYPIPISLYRAVLTFYIPVSDSSHILHFGFRIRNWKGLFQLHNFKCGIYDTKDNSGPATFRYFTLNRNDPCTQFLQDNSFHLPSNNSMSLPSRHRTRKSSVVNRNWFRKRGLLPEVHLQRNPKSFVCHDQKVFVQFLSQVSF